MVAQAGPAALSTLFDDALRQLPADREHTPASDGFLYSGNRHESVPRALFLDTRLTPLERNAWQIIRLMLNADGVTAFPTYDQLRPYLASTPCAQQASYETVARALTLLRLTRWLSLVRRRRDPKTGRIKGNLYVLHDEPLMGVALWQGLIGSATTPEALTDDLYAMEVQRIAINMQISLLHTLGRQAQECAAKVAQAHACWR